jgi:hypothetical protein
MTPRFIGLILPILKDARKKDCLTFVTVAGALQTDEKDEPTGMVLPQFLAIAHPNYRT